jgi:hypothetical protein
MKAGAALIAVFLAVAARSAPVTLQGAPDRSYDELRGKKLAAAAYKRTRRRFGRRCYRYVTAALRSSGMVTARRWQELGIPTRSAADFAVWAELHPESLDQALNLRKIATPQDSSAIPLGSVVVYDRGHCGYSRKHGHIGIVSAPGRLASDGREPLHDRCTATPEAREKVHVYVPVS